MGQRERSKLSLYVLGAGAILLIAAVLQSVLITVPGPGGNSATPPTMGKKAPATPADDAAAVADRTPAEPVQTEPVQAEPKTAEVSPEADESVTPTGTLPQPQQSSATTAEDAADPASAIANGADAGLAQRTPVIDPASEAESKASPSAPESSEAPKDVEAANKVESAETESPAETQDELVTGEATKVEEKPEEQESATSDPSQPSPVVPSQPSAGVMSGANEETPEQMRSPPERHEAAKATDTEDMSNEPATATSEESTPSTSEAAPEATQATVTPEDEPATQKPADAKGVSEQPDIAKAQEPEPTPAIEARAAEAPTEPEEASATSQDEPVAEGSADEEEEPETAEAAKSSRPAPAPVVVRKTKQPAPEPVQVRRAAHSKKTVAPQAQGRSNARPMTLGFGRDRAKSPGGAATKRTNASYAAQVRAAIGRYRPRAAGGGSATVTFGVGTMGALRFVQISRSSGKAQLDRAALATVRSAAPFPPPPPGVNRSFTIRIYFR